MKRIDILKLLESGQITVEEASKLLTDAEFEDDEEYGIGSHRADDCGCCCDEEHEDEDEDDDEDHADDDEDDEDGCCCGSGNQKNADIRFDFDMDSIKTFVSDQVTNVVNKVSKLGDDISKKIAESAKEKEREENEEIAESRQVRVNLYSSSIYVKCDDVRDFEIRVSDPDTGETVKLPERFEVLRVGESIRISEKGKEFMGINFGSPNCVPVHIDLICPNSEPYQLVRISTMSGSIESRGVLAQSIALNTLSGSVSIADSNPETLTINTVSGRIEIDEVAADRMKFTSVSGSVLCIARNSAVRMIQSKSVSGNLKFEVGSLLYDSKFNTVSGSVELRGGRLEDQNLRVNTVSGRLTVPFGERTKNGKEFRYLDGEESTLLVVSTVSGRVKIENNGL